MRKLILLSLYLMAFVMASAQDFSYTDIAQQYSLVEDNGKKVVSGFVSLPGKTDQTIFANALLWTIENVSPKMREGIRDINFTRMSFNCDWVIKSDDNSKLNNVYYCKAEFRVSEGKLVYYLSDILMESSMLIMKKITPIEKLQPEKKDSHKTTVNDFVAVESKTLNGMFDYVSTYKLQPMTHWEEVKISKVVKGMNEDECRLAFGKPQAIIDNESETQWMYNSSFYLFFKKGVVNTFLK